MKAIFSADLHGNINQFKLLFQKAKDYGIDMIIIGGDIAPKEIHDSIKGQKLFLKNELIPLIKDYQSKNQYNILIMLGNDDWASCLDVLEEYDGKLFNLIHMKKVEIDNFNFVGYSFVPITPFGIKDWEKWDNGKQSTYNIRLEGVKSKGNEMIEFKFDPNDKSDSIENDLNELSKLSNQKNTIYVFHSPPFNTKLDMISQDIHVGSKAIKKFIEKNQPFLSLHAHIHESVDISGEFIDEINKTRCVGIGNYHNGPILTIVIFDTNDLTNIKREIILA
jgi:Icc-related predicted phosphoesterase